MDRFINLNTTVHFKDTLRLSHSLVLNKRKFPRVKSEHLKLIMRRRNNGRYKTVKQEKVPEFISIIATRCPIFRDFGFTTGDTIILEI